MSLQGPLIVVAKSQAGELVEFLRAAGAFPVVESNWSDAPTAFVAVKPNAIIIAEPGPPPSETSARMLCLQVATATGPVVPVLAFTRAGEDAAIPIALPIDTDLPQDRLIARLNAALRVRALHATVLRRIESYGANNGTLPQLPFGDALDDATVLIAGRGATYPALSVAWGDRVKMVGALSVETAAQNLNARDIDGIVIADGFSSQMVEAFLTALADEPRFRDLPVAILGDVMPEFAQALNNVDHVIGDASRVVAHMVPRVRMHALEARLGRMLKALETEGMFDPETGLMAHSGFHAELAKAMAEASRQSQALSVARITLEGVFGHRGQIDSARLVTRLIRTIDFAGRDEDGSILIAFTQTDLSSAHVIARRIAGTLKKAMLAPGQVPVTAHVTLATMKAVDTPQTLMARVAGAQTVPAE